MGLRRALRGVEACAIAPFLLGKLKGAIRLVDEDGPHVAMCLAPWPIRGNPYTQRGLDLELHSFFMAARAYGWLP